jgi:endonuclease/exonuclease/phosphatase family metal-dependent hydrolase
MRNEMDKRKTIAAVLRVLAVTLCLLGASPAVAQTGDTALRVMTFNVRLPVSQDGDNAWERRQAVFIETIAQVQPDIIGMQELYQRQADHVIEHLPDYAWFGIDRRGGHGDEHVGIFYRRDRFTVLDSGDFWLSETPGVAGSITWGNLFPRLVSWGLFEDKATGRRFHVLNTHLPYRAEDGEARLNAARLIAAWIARLPSDAAVVLIGDFNVTPDGPVHALLSDGLTDVRIVAPVTSGPDGTFHNFTGVADRRIDWILVRGFRAQSARTVTTHRDGRYPSDHFPVVADLVFGSDPTVCAHQDTPRPGSPGSPEDAPGCRQP